MADTAPVDLIVDMTEPPASNGEQLVSDASVEAGADNVVVVANESDDEDPLPANAEMQADGSVILTMKFPVTMRWRRQGSDDIREEKRTTLHMYRLNGAAMRAVMSAGKGHAVTTGAAKSCRMAQQVFDKLWDMMDAADTNAIAQVFNFFLDGGTPKARGQQSSP